MRVYIISDPAIDAAGVDLPVVTWDEINRDRTTKVLVHYEPRRWVSRHESAERKRPYCVRYALRGFWGWPASYHATLPAAVKAAARLSAELQ